MSGTTQRGRLGLKPAGRQALDSGGQFYISRLPSQRPEALVFGVEVFEVVHRLVVLPTKLAIRLL